MMKFWEDRKEKLKKFLKADVLAECRQQVDHENRVVLCLKQFHGVPVIYAGILHIMEKTGRLLP